MMNHRQQASGRGKARERRDSAAAVDIASHLTRALIRAQIKACLGQRRGSIKSAKATRRTCMQTRVLLNVGQLQSSVGVPKEDI